VSVSSALIGVFNVALDVDITHSFHVHGWAVLTVIDTETELVVKDGLFSDVPHFTGLFFLPFSLLVYLYPAVYFTL
jgi:hypothetical protein